jgi:hypothetical protein
MTEMKKHPKNTQKRIFAIVAAVPASPKKPRAPANNPMIKKAAA